MSSPAQPGNGALSWLTARPIAHRGLHDADTAIIENTAAAVSAAISANYAVEVDLRLSADGDAMVFHDFTLDRLTEAHGPLAARTADALRQIPFRGADARIMSLGELTALVAGRTPLILEIKSQWDNVGPLEQRVVQLLRNYDGPVAVMSFDPASLAVFRNIAPNVMRGIVSERFRDKDYWSNLSAWRRFTLRHMLHAAATAPHFIAYDINGLPSAAPLLARYLFGVPLLTWTVRTPSQRRRARLFADAMIFEGFRP